MPGSLLKQLARRTRLIFVIFLLAWLLPLLVNFPVRYEPRIDTAFEFIALVAFFLQLGIWANVVVSYWTHSYVTNRADTGVDITTVNAIALLIKIVLWALLAMLVLEQGFHKSVLGLVGALGIGGIAIAFALQNVLSDLFAAMAIVTDKPFVIGDAIAVDSFSGKVEHIGLKSTRVRADTGEQIVFGNADLLKGRIRNFGRMEQRLAALTTSVGGSTPPDKLARIPKIIREIVEDIPNTRFVRSSLTGISDTTADFSTLYYLCDPAYQVYVDAQQTVMLEIMRRLKAEGVMLGAQVEFAVKEKAAGLNPSPPATA